MKFNIETRDGSPFVGPPAVGDVYPIRGGRGLRYGHQFVVIGIKEQARMAYSLIIDRSGEVCGVHSVGLHVLEEMVPTARVDGLDQLEFTVRGNMSKRIIFELSMPSNNSWDGKWSGAGNTYTVAKTLPAAKAEALKPRYTYAFGDGWVAAVRVREAAPREKATNRFCGYEWMIDSILKRDAITAD